MNDVKYLCEQLLDDGPPPLRESAEVLARARRSTARRSAFRATGGALAVAAVTGAALLVVPAATTISRTPLTVGPAAPPAASTPAPPVDLPYARAAGNHDKQMLNVILGALPAGYTGTSQYPLSTSSTPYPTDPGQGLPGGASALLLTNISVLVNQDGRFGWLSATMINDGRPVPGDLCGSAPNCQVVDVNGGSIKLTHEHWDNTAPEIDVIVATRYLRDGSPQHRREP